MKMKRIAVDPETFVRLSCARASTEDVVTVLGAAKCSAFIEFFPDKSLSNEPWTGEGLPPVGTVCEFMKHNSPPAPEGQWTVGEIRYVSDCYVIIGGEGCEHAHHPRNCSFRPVRTPEQIAAEDREAAIFELVKVTCIRHGEAGRIYDAGYRKQVQP